MPRKKTTQTESTEAMSGVAVAEPQAPAALPPSELPEWIEGPPVPPVGGEATTAEPQKNWGDPYKRIFSSTAKGFEMGENRRFKQRVFMFRERPEESVIDVLKENGFTYRPAEKAWTIPANADTRRLSDELAQQFAGEAQGFER